MGPWGDRLARLSAAVTAVRGCLRHAVIFRRAVWHRLYPPELFFAAVTDYGSARDPSVHLSRPGLRNVEPSVMMYLNSNWHLLERIVFQTSFFVQQKTFSFFVCPAKALKRRLPTFEASLLFLFLFLSVSVYFFFQTQVRHFSKSFHSNPISCPSSKDLWQQRDKTKKDSFLNKRKNFS